MVHTALPEDKHRCKKCGSSHVDIFALEGKRYQACLDCGEEEEIAEKDLEFARRTEEALERYEKGRFKSVPADVFLKELDRC